MVRYKKQECILEGNRPHVYYEAWEGRRLGVGHTKEQALADLQRSLTPTDEGAKPFTSQPE
jgi:hypothetical protein